MVSHRWRSVWVSLSAIVILWIVALWGYHVFERRTMTAEKVQAYVDTMDLSRLTGEERARAIRELARRLNALSAEERRKARMGRSSMGWFNEMTEEEKSWFIGETMPSGIKQALTAFEELPEEKRRQAIDDALQNLRQANVRAATGAGQGGAMDFDTNRPPISPELEAKIREIGLKTFYSQSSAQTKAELAPVLEEIQRGMESGRIIRGRGRRH